MNTIITQSMFTKEQQLKAHYQNKLLKAKEKAKQKLDEKLAKAKEKLLKTREKSKLKVKEAKAPSIAQLKKSVQKVVNKYVRDRDKDEPCISCRKFCEHGEAGHYIAQGSSGALRYNLDNINKQCTACNHYEHANLVEYRIYLVQKIGAERVEWLEQHRHDSFKWTREALQEVVERLKEL